MFKTASFLDFAVLETACWSHDGTNIEMKDLKPGPHSNLPHFFTRYPVGINPAGFW